MYVDLDKFNEMNEGFLKSLKNGTIANHSKGGKNVHARYVNYSRKVD